jgi:ferredoxin
MAADARTYRYPVKVDLLKCTGCGACTLICPVAVLRVEDMKCRVSEGCIDCGKCVDICHWRAITLEKIPEKRKKNVKVVLKEPRTLPSDLTS